MEIYSKLFKIIEQGNSLDGTETSIKTRIIHFIEINKKEIYRLKQQEILLQAACSYYNSLAQNFANRNLYWNNMSNKSTLELCKFTVPPFPIIILAEAVSIFLNEDQRWNSFHHKYAFKDLIQSIDYNQLSDQVLYDLGIIINANRKNIETMFILGAGNLFCWLATTYDWAIAIRDNFPQFTSFKEIDRLVNKELLEYSTLETVRKSIKNKERELELLKGMSVKFW